MKGMASLGLEKQKVKEAPQLVIDTEVLEDGFTPLKL
jgi:hypothetical protein